MNPLIFPLVMALAGGMAFITLKSSTYLQRHSSVETKKLAEVPDIVSDRRRLVKHITPVAKVGKKVEVETATTIHKCLPDRGWGKDTYTGSRYA